MLIIFDIVFFSSVKFQKESTKVAHTDSYISNLLSQLFSSRLLCMFQQERAEVSRSNSSNSLVSSHLLRSNRRVPVKGAHSRHSLVIVQLTYYIYTIFAFPNGLVNTNETIIFKNTTTLLSFRNMFRCFKHHHQPFIYCCLQGVLSLFFPLFLFLVFHFIG